MSIGFILLIVILFLIFGGGYGYHRYGYSRYGGGGYGLLGLIVIVLIILWLFGGGIGMGGPHIVR